MSSARVFLVAAEPSGDLLARETAEHLRAIDAGVHIDGIGGHELAKVGIQSPIDITPLSILGLFEGLKAYPLVIKLADAAADAIIAAKPDAVVLVDSWGFMLRVAQRVRARDPRIKLIKLVGPQVWATRAGRAKTLAETVDHLICIHHMEVPYYQKYDLPVTVMGNPALARAEKGHRHLIRERLGLGENENLLLVLPGSRPSEIKRVAPALVEAAWIAKAERPDVQVIMAPAASVREQFIAAFPSLEDWASISENDDRMADIMAASDYALACSGTVTTELAVQGTPFLVGYSTGWITWFLARYFLFKPNHITLLNIAADDSDIAPEFIQTDLKPQDMADHALEMLADRSKLEAQALAQNKALSRMGERDEAASEIAARTILGVIAAR